MIIKSIVPEYGKNYDKGYIGFQYTKGNFLSVGIAWFEKFERMGDIKVSHAFVVLDGDFCIEANAPGVEFTKLEDKFNNPKVQVFFRKPRGWTKKMGKGITESASELIGRPYDYSSIAGLFLSRTIVGSFLNLVARKLPERALTGIFNSRKGYFCSEVCAYALRKQGFDRIGCLSKPDRMIDPQMLFEDDEVFYPWKQAPPRWTLANPKSIN